MWSVKQRSEQTWSGGPIVPLSVLYSYDHPLTFVATIGFELQLFHNIGQRGERLFYVAALVKQDVLDALESGLLSVYGAINKDVVRIVETDFALDVKRYWTTPFDSIPTHLLPQRGTPLHAGYQDCPDTIEQATGFFSMRFIGEELKRSGAPFNLVKRVIDDGYEAARRLLSPSFLIGARASTFDFNVSLVSSSLLLKLNLPAIDREKLKRRSNLSVDDVQSAFSRKRDEALEILSEINRAVGKSSAREFVSKNESIISDIVPVIPTEDGRISEVEFSGQSSSTRIVSIGRRTGAALASVLHSLSKDNINDSGIIKIVNSSSKYFVYDSVRGRKVACRIPYDVFDRLNQSSDFRQGTGVKVQGRLVLRKIRDEIVCEAEPELVDPTGIA